MHPETAVLQQHLQQGKQNLVRNIECCADSIPLALWVRIIDSLLAASGDPAELRLEGLALLIQVLTAALLFQACVSCLRLCLLGELIARHLYLLQAYSQRCPAVLCLLQDGRCCTSSGAQPSQD